ncbi:glycosyltransferase family 1 protein [Thiohalocapsa sp. ML1]|jgi:glycosyltransferase involved in cell wall biosynthesis|uniref:glycosyltransferase family 4 protein n=1 Tax=Thiohalocapsa sp. ML1 TaxID=1431688 RepID=UPI000731F054|nr:glycosyltransferase family 1 protein [Thiohalocapsa sp. ML1]
MRIGISAFAGDGGKSGISQYMANIVGRLVETAPRHQFIAFVGAADADWVRSWHPGLDVVVFPNWTAHPIASIGWHLLRLQPTLRKHGCDAVFMPAANRRLAWSYGVPSLGTVHDFSQLHVPQKYDALRMAYIMRVLPAMMRRLTSVIAVSESTRRDLESFARVPPERVRVIHNGADLTRFTPALPDGASAAMRAALGIDGPYLLYTARLEHPGKNHVRLLQAFAELRRSQALPHRLVLAGGRWSGAEAIDAKVAELDLGEAVIFPGFVPDALLPALYAGAEVFVFPSLFEGFGIPVLEAMAAGTPVCAADTSSIPEVVGDAGLLFDPADPAAIAAAMARLLEDRDLRQQLIERGLARAQQFTWDRAAAAVLKALDALAAQPGR